MPKRKADAARNMYGSMMVAIVAFAFAFVYYVFVVLTWLPRFKQGDQQALSLLLLIIYHVLAFMLGWSFIQTVITDPGEVPIYWGFRVGDPDDRRRRYCLMCNLYKPERCHHCSTCGRCILNMDHHCPWVNNCIGFWNRKYFMLLLFYVQISTIFIIISLSYDVFKSFVWVCESVINFKSPHIYEFQLALFTIVAFCFSCLICLLMFFFFKFHRKLARENKTTIENLENKDKNYISKYDINESQNIEQIMGTSFWLWPFPIMPSFAVPKGEGIYFDRKFNSEEDEEGEGEGDDDNQINDQDNQDNAADQRSPSNIRGGSEQDFIQGNQGNSQTNLHKTTHTPNQVSRPGSDRRTNAQNTSNEDVVAQQQSKMIIHKNSANDLKNLNNIVQQDNTNDDNRSCEQLNTASPKNVLLGQNNRPKQVMPSSYNQEGIAKTIDSKDVKNQSPAAFSQSDLISSKQRSTAKVVSQANQKDTVKTSSTNRVGSSDRYTLNHIKM